MAPTCNTQIGAVNSVAEHQSFILVLAGIGVNTDNRLMSDVSPTSELVTASPTNW